MENKFTFQGHTFDDEKQLLAAKKEAEAIEYLRSKTDFNNFNQLFNLYNRILDRDMMETVVGIAFLKEIRDTLISCGLFKEEQIRPLPLPKVKKQEKKREEIRKNCQKEVDSLWDEIKRMVNPHIYYVDLSQKLWDLKQELLNKFHN